MKDLEAGPDPDLEMTSSAKTMDQNLNLFLEEAENVKKKWEKSVKSWADSRKLMNKANMDRANAANKRLSGCKEGTPIYRTRIAVTNGLRKKLKELMMEFQGLRQKMMTEYKDTVGRRYFTVTGEYPNEDVIEKIISDGNGGEEFLTRAIQEHGRGKVLETVVEIQDRHDTAKEIEKSLLELHQIFLDMAVMVEAQGEQMDDIEHHVMNASHYVKDGTKELKTAKDYHRSSRKWMCIGLILLLLIILVIVIPIATSFSSS
ncbi:hypothetical protein JRO89_XS08G0091000 [Xanthoceras sorbifolium]|uniref:t-SNARE coiled-coil homology domain-containing protein n=1 Tax=Xanthoceras sorbifolium TaxID=99658 RepID=A0ABQ8HP72_9ROSI|nr:hypothetical protein JRO89_XS08G0091000 [Xanthoceras sorbifolium]